MLETRQTEAQEETEKPRVGEYGGTGDWGNQGLWGSQGNHPDQTHDTNWQWNWRVSVSDQ